MPDTFRRAYVKLTEEQVGSMDNLKMIADTLECALINNFPPGRERALALTKLEECVMWATKGLTA